jgi:YaaC-like Protein
MAPKRKPVATFREGDSLRIGRETVSFGRNIIVRAKSGFVVQPRLFVNDPWPMIAEGIHRASPKGKTRDIAHSFRRQAEDYFLAATVARELAVRPVLLYYAFMNLAKAYAVAKGNAKLAGRAFHGVKLATGAPRAISDARITFETQSTGRPGVFQELLRHLDGNPHVLTADLRLGYLLPQILPGHRLWCYAARRRERFLPVEHFHVRHPKPARQVWLNLYLRKSDLDRIGLTEGKLLSEADIGGEFEPTTAADPYVCFQQRNPESYGADPAEALDKIIRNVRNKIWETVKITSPYRKAYVYCCPAAEQGSRLPQMSSVYLLMFFLSSVTRYSPLYFDDLLDSRYGPLIETFVVESPMQFLYLMASEILGQEVSKPAII